LALVDVVGPAANPLASGRSETRKNPISNRAAVDTVELNRADALDYDAVIACPCLSHDETRRAR
jgi:hypothetical protein